MSVSNAPHVVKGGDVSHYAQTEQKISVPNNYDLKFRFCAESLSDCTDYATCAFNPDPADGSLYVKISRWEDHYPGKGLTWLAEGAQPIEVFWINFTRVYDPIRSPEIGFALACGPVSDPIVYGLENMGSGAAHFLLQHPDNCALLKRKGLSSGTIFLIVILVLIPVYIIAGCIWNYKRNGTALGCESCPNRAFWKNFWINSKTGCAVTWAWLRSKCGRGNSYSSTGHEEV